MIRPVEARTIFASSCISVMAMSGWSRSRLTNVSGETEATNVSANATTVAERGWPSSAASSPKTPPGSISSKLISRPDREKFTTRTRPSTTK